MGKSTSEESEKLSLAIYALSEVATKKLKSRIILLEDELDTFCHSILSREEEKQIELINNLCTKTNSTNLLIEELIPKTADKLGNMWKQDQVSFIDVSFAVDRLQKLLRIYEKKYLGPLYLDYKGPAILLILPKTETHSLGILTASMIMKKKSEFNVTVPELFVKLPTNFKEASLLIVSSAPELIVISSSKTLPSLLAPSSLLIIG